MLLPRQLYFDVGGFDLGLGRWGCGFHDLMMKVYAAGGVCAREPSVVVGHLFRRRFPYAMSHGEMVYNKLRIGFVHLPDGGFQRLVGHVRGKPGFDHAWSRFQDDLPEIDRRRLHQRQANHRGPEWYVRTFLPGLREDAPTSPPVPKQKRASAMKEPVDRDRMEAFARALRKAEDGSQLSPELFKSLHIGFRAEDAGGITWTVGLHDLIWRRIEQGKWVADQPPDTLLMESGIGLALDVLREREGPVQEGREEPTSGRETSPNAVVKAKKMENLARTLQRANAAEPVTPSLYQALHARFRGEDDKGRSWTVGVHDLTWYRLDGGTWVAGKPPGKLTMPMDLLTALEEIAPLVSTPADEVPAENRRCPNPECGKEIKPGKKFCVGCGARVS